MRFHRDVVIQILLLYFRYYLNSRLISVRSNAVREYRRLANDVNTTTYLAICIQITRQLTPSYTARDDDGSRENTALRYANIYLQTGDRMRTIDVCLLYTFNRCIFVYRKPVRRILHNMDDCIIQ